MIYLLMAQGRAPSRGGTLSYPSGDQPQHSGGPQGYRQVRYSPAEMPPPGNHPSRQTARWPWIAGGLVLVLALLFAGGFTLFGNGDDENVADEITVTYEVLGTGSEAAVTYLDQDRDMAQETGVSLPWSKQVPVGGRDPMVSMTAANGPDGGDITCRILVGGRVMTEQTSSGPYASASCSGDAGEQ
ncbi:MmpS family transport accessory protein [Nocardia carnea]|uniref:MmpS family transport accessory protein n=1 Tax=Nocardia carnea TaxID=37328 RepID=UPI002456AD93|nr:MmpS family transport accessory protein [Nocardia carnea]